MDRISREMAGRYWYFRSDKAARELGHEPRDGRVTLLDTVLVAQGPGPLLTTTAPGASDTVIAPPQRAVSPSSSIRMGAESPSARVSCCRVARRICRCSISLRPKWVPRVSRKARIQQRQRAERSDQNRIEAAVTRIRRRCQPDPGAEAARIEHREIEQEPGSHGRFVEPDAKGPGERR